MAADIRPLSLRTEADAELRTRELGHSLTARSEALRLRRTAFKVHELTPDEAKALQQAITALGGEALFSNSGSEAIFCLAEGRLRALAALLEGASELAQRIEALARGLEPPRWVDGRGHALLKANGATIMGILNVTPDSFSDGGRYLDPALAEEAALHMIAEGAGIIDVGGLSTRPGASEIDAEDEARRVIPVITRLAAKISAPISVDTYRASVACQALDAGARIVNDISGFTFDADLPRVCAEHGAAVVLMHTPAKPAVMMQHTAYRDLIRDVRRSLETALTHAVQAGIAFERVALDPGFGFGKTADQGWEMLRRLAEFRGLGRPLLVGISRKSFFRSVLGEDRLPIERDIASGAAAAIAVLHGAQIIRTHNVKATADCLAVADQIARAPRLTWTS